MTSPSSSFPIISLAPPLPLALKWIILGLPSQWPANILQEKKDFNSYGKWSIIWGAKAIIIGNQEIEEKQKKAQDHGL